MSPGSILNFASAPGILQQLKQQGAKQQVFEAALVGLYRERVTSLLGKMSGRYLEKATSSASAAARNAGRVGGVQAKFQSQLELATAAGELLADLGPPVLSALQLAQELDKMWCERNGEGR